MCLGGTDSFLLPGLPGHRGPDGESKTKLVASYSTSWAKLSFQKSAPVTPFSVDQARFQGRRRCHGVAVDTPQFGRVFTMMALVVVAKNI